MRTSGQKFTSPPGNPSNEVVLLIKKYEVKKNESKRLKFSDFCFDVVKLKPEFQEGSGSEQQMAIL